MLACLLEGSVPEQAVVWAKQASQIKARIVLSSETASELGLGTVQKDADVIRGETQHLRDSGARQLLEHPQRHHVPLDLGESLDASQDRRVRLRLRDQLVDGRVVAGQRLFVNGNMRSRAMVSLADVAGRVPDDDAQKRQRFVVGVAQRTGLPQAEEGYECLLGGVDRVLPAEPLSHRQSAELSRMLASESFDPPRESGLVCSARHDENR